MTSTGRRWVVWAWLAALSSTMASQSAAPLVVAAVDVQGVRRYAVTDVARVSGVAPGQTLSVADLDAAVNRMAATGLFTEVAYRYATRAGRTTVTFIVAEPEWSMPVEFDNFVWFSDEALVAAIRETVPSFDGTAPALAGFSDLLTRELQNLLKSRNIEGTVLFLPQGTLGKDIERYTFKVSNPSPRLCSLSFAGASAIKQSELTAALSLPPNADHSVSFLRSASHGTLTNLYRQRGYWRAGFGSPRATFVQSEQCSGAAVTVPVDEGSVYALDRNEWTGNTVLAASQLDQLVPLPKGAPVNIMLIEDAQRRIRRAYGAQGYIMQQASYDARLDDAGKTVVLAFTVNEGPQFKMGSLSFPGLDVAGAAVLTKEWRVKPGDVYDADYPGKFADQVIRPRLRPGTKPPDIRVGVDAEKRLVNVAIAFGS